MIPTNTLTPSHVHHSLKPRAVVTRLTYTFPSRYRCVDRVHYFGTPHKLYPIHTVFLVCSSYEHLIHASIIPSQGMQCPDSMSMIAHMLASYCWRTSEEDLSVLIGPVQRSFANQPTDQSVLALFGTRGARLSIVNLNGGPVPYFGVPSIRRHMLSN